MKARKSVAVRPVFSRCPWREREVHATSKPGVLTEAEVQDIERKILENGYRSLPDRGIAGIFYLCPDCRAVWLAASIFERVAEDRICGVYDEIPMWTPYPLMEKGK
jgi:hypothetical protein